MQAVSSDTALTTVSVFSCPVLDIKDGQITHANRSAARIYGYDDAADLAGRFISDLQLPQSREAGRKRWAIRQEGHNISSTYCTLVRRPDGEVVGHRGTMLSTMKGVHGESYLTGLEHIRELEEPSAPDLLAYGISEERAEIHTGLFTVAKVRAMSRKVLTLHFGERFPMIIDECERVSTTYFQWAPGRGLDFALRNDLCTWSLSEKASTLLYLRHSCYACGRAWDGKRPPGTTMCPSGKEHLERYPEMGKTDRVDRRRSRRTVAAHS